MTPTRYRERTFDALKTALATAAPVAKALDFGAGDGYFCQQMIASGLAREVLPLDVVERSRSLVRPQLYGGGRLPFDDRKFDLVYAVDVLHHCPDPLFALDEMMRCSGRWVMLKDHNCSGPIGHWTLAVLDELGNRRFGIPSPGLYQRGWNWVAKLEAKGFVRRHWIHPTQCHVGPLGALTNSLQFTGLWERQ